MIERNNSSTKKISTIKTKCKIHLYHYFIQIYIDAFVKSEKITFLIRAKKGNERNSILYKKIFNYIELIDYNKYFKTFSSLEDIFISIAQCLEEKKYNINNNFKCLSLILRIYIIKLKKYVNIIINLNQHKNLNPLSVDNNGKKDIKKIMLGIQNKEELSFAIYDIRQRLKNLEMNQSIMNNNANNNNLDITYRNSELNHINNNLQQYINNSTNLTEYLNNNNNTFQIKYYNKNLNKRKFNNKISANSNINNVNKENNMYHQNNSVLNMKNTNYFKNSSNNLFPKNLKLNEKYRISGIDEIIKKINLLEIKTNTKDNQEKDLDYKLNQIDFKNKDQYKYMPHSNKKNKEINKSVEINRRNENSIYNLHNNNSQINLVKKNQLDFAFNNEKGMNGSHIINNKDMNKNDTDKSNEINLNKNIINNINKNIKENNYIKKFLNKNKTIGYNENDNRKNTNKIKKNNSVIIKDDENEEIMKKKIGDKVHLSKSKTGREQNIKNKAKNRGREKRSNNKIKKVHYENDNYFNNDDNIKIKEKEYDNIRGNDNLGNINGIKNNIENSSEKESENIKNFIKKKNTNQKVESRNNNYNKMPKIKIKNFSSAIKDNINNTNSNYIINIYKNNINNNTVNSLSSKPIIKQNLNRSISSSSSNIYIKTPKKLPIYPPEQISNYINSNIILRKVELNFIKNKISNNNKKHLINFNLLYRATRDGDNDGVIKKLTLGYEKVMTLFYTNEGARFGIFIKRKKNHYIRAKDRGEKTGTCFIFGLNNLVAYDIFKNKNGKGDYNKVLCFGCLDDIGSNGTKWMIYTPQNNFLNKKCVMGSGIGLFYDIDIEQIVGPCEYTIKEVEYLI